MTTLYSGPSRPGFILPMADDFPFDSVCHELVIALRKRDFRAPGMEVEFDVYGTGDSRVRMVREIRGDDFRVYFGRPQGRLDGGKFNNTAAVNTITIPRMSITVYEDNSGPSFKVYAGDDYGADRDWFVKSSAYGCNSKLRGERRRYVSYEGGWDVGLTHWKLGLRAPLLVADHDLGREYMPEPGVPCKVPWALSGLPLDGNDLPPYFDTDVVMRYFAHWLRADVLARVLEAPEPEVVGDPFGEPEPPAWPGEIVGPVFTFADHEDVRRIRKGQQGPEGVASLPAPDRYGMVMTWKNSRRVVPYGQKTTVDFPKDLGHDGYMWCGVREVAAETHIDALEIPGFYRWPDRMQFVVRITPRHAGGIYVADFHGEYDDGAAETARTIVPAHLYEGGNSNPVVLVSRELWFDEVEVVSGPWPDKYSGV